MDDKTPAIVFGILGALAGILLTVIGFLWTGLTADVNALQEGSHKASERLVAIEVTLRHIEAEAAQTNQRLTRMEQTLDAIGNRLNALETGGPFIPPARRPKRP